MTIKKLLLSARLVFCAFFMGMLFQACAHTPDPKKQERTLIPRQLLFGNPVKTSPQISPDGTKLAYVAPDAQAVLNIWIRDLQHPQQSDQQATFDQNRGVRRFLWQLDSQHLLYVQDKDGDENWHLYQTALDTKETKDLTPHEDIQVDFVAYEKDRPNLLLIQSNQREKGLFDVYLMDLTTGESVLAALNPDNAFNWVADHDLQVRAVQSYTKEGDQLIRIRAPHQEEWQELMTIPSNEIIQIVGFSPDNQSLYLLSSMDHQTCRLVSLDLTTKEQQILAEDAHYDLEDQCLVHPQTNHLEAIGVERERFEWIVLNPSIQADLQTLQGKDPRACFKLTSRDLANQKWVVASYSDDRPVHFYLYDKEEGNLAFLFSAQPALEEYSLSKMQPVAFIAQDGMQIHAYLTLPSNQEARSLPAILLVHGGPWVRDTWGFRPEVQWLADRGYAVLQINYRGSTGYGKDYLNAGNREWAGKMHQDLLDGKQWLIDQGIADPQRVAIYGGSYGGYATLVGLSFTPDAFCCGVDLVGPSSLITLIENSPPYWAPLKSELDLRIGNLEDDAEFLKSRSPLFKAHQITKPLLIGQGANDPRVKQSESDQIVAAMRLHQLPVEYLLFADEGHGFAKPVNRLKFYAAAELFFSKYLGGQSEVPNAQENWEALKR